MPYTPTPISDPWITQTRGPSASGDPGYTQTAQDYAAPVQVYRYDPSQIGNNAQTLLYNVLCLDIEYQEGAHPGTATFMYVFGLNDSTCPNNSFQALDLGTVLQRTVLTNDRLVVIATRPDGVQECLFDGLALRFGLHLDGDREQVLISGVGIAKRQWNIPIGGQFIRNDNDLVNGTCLQTDIPCRFNPKGLPNATPQGADYNDGQNNTYPVFTDIHHLGDTGQPQKWTLPMAAKYLLGRGNPSQWEILTPPAGYLDSTLFTKLAKPGAILKRDNPNTYDRKEIFVPDIPITGKDWPNVLYGLLRDAGFAMTFRPQIQISGTPRTRLGIYGQQDGPLKALWLQPYYTTYDPNFTNLAGTDIERDLTEVANRWIVEGDLYEYEATFILAPAYPSVVADAQVTNLQKWTKNDSGFAGVKDYYRKYILDETGSGHYDVGKSAPITTATDLKPVLNPDGTTPFVVRLRKPSGELLTKQQNKEPFKAELAISTDYAGTKPGVWDGTGTWQVVNGGWELLKDRIGIYINIEDPNKWDIGKGVAGQPFRDGKVNGVEYQANATNPATGRGKPFYLRLTCKIQGDKALKGIADIQKFSILPNEVIERRTNARDRLKYQVVAANSLHSNGPPLNAGGKATIVRDDTDQAITEATNMRSITEQGMLSGNVELSRLTTYYEIGDRIGYLNGRGLGFRTDGGDKTNDPVYPVVVGRRFDFRGGQRTYLTISDAGADRRQLERRMHRTEEDHS